MSSSNTIVLSGFHEARRWDYYGRLDWFHPSTYPLYIQHLIIRSHLTNNDGFALFKFLAANGLMPGHIDYLFRVMYDYDRYQLLYMLEKLRTDTFDFRHYFCMIHRQVIK